MASVELALKYGWLLTGAGGPDVRILANCLETCSPGAIRISQSWPEP